jgi:hypothetical protein
MEEKARQEFLKSIYEQHWLHARHVENERLWFTNIFGIIVAGLLAFLGTIEDKETPFLFAIYAGSFIFALSMLGYFFCLTWRAPFVEHTVLARKMLETDPLLERYAPCGKGYTRIKILGITAHELFLYFYALMSGAGLYLILYVGLAKCYWWISIILFFVLCLVWRGLRLFWHGLGLHLLSKALKASWKRRFRVLWQRLPVLLRTALGALWRGLKGREDDYRNQWGVGKW